MPVAHQTTAPALPFDLLAPGVGAGAPPPAGWQRLTALPLLVLVGVTGVGKSTTLDALAGRGARFTLLPDRRALTDRLLIAAMQAADGAPIAPVADRKLRFAYTRRYRECYPGGMAHALAQLWVEPPAAGVWLIFDGLRGANEVEYAAKHFPAAKFLMLDAPDWMRVRRLIKRRDRFDQIAQTAAPVAADAADDLAALGAPEAAALFTPAEQQMMLAWVRQGEVSAEELRAKLQIVVEERRSYDPAATLAALRAHAPARACYVDTTVHAPAAVVERLIALMAGQAC
ncbi:MAG TPA: hypothetical protein VNK95_09275 [Caldilineaceae bacterium]|nr:hypothetical protein [Caldilineaceae bacterium]